MGFLLLFFFASNIVFAQDSSYLPLAKELVVALKQNDKKKLQRFYFGSRELDTVQSYLLKEGFTREQIREELDKMKAGRIRM